MSLASLFSTGGDWRELSIGIVILVALQLLAALIVYKGSRMERQGILRRQSSEVNRQAEIVSERNAIAERVESIVSPDARAARRLGADKTRSLL
jgi:hypothetical protein